MQERHGNVAGRHRGHARKDVQMDVPDAFCIQPEMDLRRLEIALRASIISRDELLAPRARRGNRGRDDHLDETA